MALVKLAYSMCSRHIKSTIALVILAYSRHIKSAIFLVVLAYSRQIKSEVTLVIFAYRRHLPFCDSTIKMLAHLNSRYIKS